MTPPAITRYLERYPALPAFGYAALLLGLLLIALFSIIDIARQFQELSNGAEILARLENRGVEGAHGASSAAPAGTPFLEGPTLTVASASLMQRVTSAITRAGGTVLSSEVESQNDNKPGQIKVRTSCTLEQLAMQQLLHELEAGMPFVFIEQLSSQSDGENKEGPLRVSLTITGLWRPK